ncbi:MAG TPA: hypothetical protein VKI19_02320, partial [Acidimicrobiales bacterium]|nr:hypothetical protein [Acidimicrobiales bacterium]
MDSPNGGVVDSDQHLYEPRGMWEDYADPADRDLDLRLVDDDRGYTWLAWDGGRLSLADVHRPGDTGSCGAHRRRLRAGQPSGYRYDDELPSPYWEVGARLEWMDRAGLASAVCFPNFGLVWERSLEASPRAQTANMRAWNRYCTDVATASRGRIFPVAHLTLRDREWLAAELAALSSAGIRMAMIAPGPVDGRALSHPDHEEIWAAFVD